MAEIFTIDIIQEILSWSTVKTLHRSKLVCKEWRSIVEDPRFHHLHTLRNPNPKETRFLTDQEIKSVVSQGDLQPNSPCSSYSLNNIYCFKIFSSYNGLLLYRGNSGQYFVSNLTTHRSRRLPCPHTVFSGRVLDLSLAFDQSYISAYKVVCVVEASPIPQFRCQILIYSSDVDAWRLSGSPFEVYIPTKFERSIFWNGSIHWLNSFNVIVVFNVDEECIFMVPIYPQLMPPVMYFGESNGHLLLVQENLFFNRINIYEMQRDYAGWYFLYEVDLNYIPEKISCSGLTIHTIHHVTKDDETENGESILFGGNGVVVHYNVHSKSVKIERKSDDSDDSLKMILNEFDVYSYSASFMNP